MEDAHILRGIDWRQTFPFTHIFRSFRVAIHPSKLILALLALILLYAGGRALDRLWPVGYRAVPGERDTYARYLATPDPAEPFSTVRDRLHDANEEQYRSLLRTYNVPAGDNLLATLPQLKNRIIDQRDQAVSEAAKTRKATTAPSELKTARQRYSTEAQAAYARASTDLRLAERIRNRGVFAEFFSGQITEINNVVNGVVHNTWTRETGAIAAIARFFLVGPGWLVRYHPVFLVIFGLWFLLVWSIFGGAIARIAAVHVARDEKLSIRSALRFSFSKLLSFFSAPLLPLSLILAIGFAVPLAGGLLSSVYVAGPVLLLAMSAFFFLAIIAGFLITLLLIGLVGGFNLMYPTIAVEGSDSFDAFSRSYSYLFARPWRLLFNTFVAVVYGAFTYFFVHLFIMLMLMAVHTFVGIGMFEQAPSTAPLWETIWPASWARLTYPLNTSALRWDQALAAYMVAFWVYLTIGMLGAYAISYYFSSNTIIYYLMRQEVDATELDDVYLDQGEEDLDESMLESTPQTPASEPPTAPSESAPPATSGQV